MFSQAQSNRFGVISGNIGANIGINAIALEKTGVSAYALEEGVGMFTHFPIELNFGLLKPISLGVNFSPSRWVLVGEDEGIVSGKFTSYGVNINLYPINTNRFNMQLSLTPSLLSFEEFSLAYNSSNQLNIDFTGTAFKARLLFNIYFSDHAGMYFDLGYSSYKIGIDNYSLKISDPELEAEIKTMADQGFNLRLPGLQAGIGVVFKIDTKKQE